MSEEKLTILFSACVGFGPFNACIGIAESLRDRGHRIVFVVPDNWRNKLSPHGFAEEWLNPISNTPTEESNSEDDPFKENTISMALEFEKTPVEQIKSVLLTYYGLLAKEAKEYHIRLQEIVKKIAPDIIVLDQMVHQPALMDAGIPWIFSYSCNPAAISSKNVPPAFSGYPTGGFKDDEKTLAIYKEEYNSVFRPFHADIKNWLLENGGPDLKFYDQPLFIKFSPYANIYMYPEELDYTEFRPNPPNFYRFDNFMRSSNEVFQIPEILKNKSGKLILFSMGTIASSEIGMMKRLVAILAKSPHRFIVSKGPLADKYDLADNMWGESYIPQTAILPIVDLVISHGGNNSVTETFNFGKPMIVLPLFGDQLDNAQRVLETGLGIRLHPCKVTETELLSAIEQLLSDDKLCVKMSKIGERIRGSNNLSRVAELVEKVVKDNKI